LLINFRRASLKKIPNLESMPMASATSDTSAPVASHTADMVLILEIRWAEEQHDFEKKKPPVFYIKGPQYTKDESDND
jgi:hypothetical protein